MKRAWTSAILVAVIGISVLASFGSARAQVPPIPTNVMVGYWGQSEINEDGNLRFRVTASAGAITWPLDVPGVEYLQLWAHISGGPATNLVDKFVLIKQKPAFNAYGPVANIGGTSAKVPLKPGMYTYELYIVIAGESADGTIVPLGTSPMHPGGTVTLP